MKVGLLEVTNVGMRYAAPGGELTVLSAVNLALEPGMAAAIVGPSGSGKSSLLYILGGLERPSSGTVRLQGQNPYELNQVELAKFRNTQIGFVFQDHCLLPQCTVLENVLIPTMIPEKDGRGSSAEFSAWAGSLIDQVGLGGRIGHRPGELSGGEKQRVAIARALIRRPHLLLCDEPTGNLDSASAEKVSTLLLGLHRTLNNILIVVTHSERLAAEFAIRFNLTDGILRRVDS